MNRYTLYEIRVPLHLMEETDAAIAQYLAAHPDASVDDAIESFFNTGVNLMLHDTRTLPQVKQS
jgi:hypothetical protein